MVRLRIGFVVVCVAVGCTVESGEGATSFGSAGNDDASSGGSAPASSEGGGSDAPGNGDEAGDDDPDSGGDPGSTSGSSSDPGSEASGDPGSESDEGGSEASSGGGSGGPLGEHDYGPCNGGGDPKSPCGDDAECIVIEGFDGSFCSPWCDDDLACPDPTAGEAFAQCQLGPDLTMPPVHCALLCDPGSDECPDGMNCVDTGMPIGVCLFQN